MCIHRCVLVHEIQSFSLSTTRFVFNCCQTGCEKEWCLFITDTLPFCLLLCPCFSFILRPSFSLPLYELVVIILANNWHSCRGPGAYTLHQTHIHGKHLKNIYVLYGKLTGPLELFEFYFLLFLILFNLFMSVVIFYG